MGLSRRTYTKKFKLAAVKRMEQGVSIAAVVQALEVNPKVLHGVSFAKGVSMPFPATGSSDEVRAGSPSWTQGRPAGAGDRFCEGVLEAHRGTGALQALTGHPRSTARSKKK